MKNAVENLWKIILRISLDLLQIFVSQLFHTVFHSVFHDASFGSRLIFHDCGKRDRQGQEHPGWTTGPAGPGPSREIQGRLAQPPTASTTIRNLKNTVFSTVIFWGRAGMSIVLLHPPFPPSTPLAALEKTIRRPSALRLLHGRVFWQHPWRPARAPRARPGARGLAKGWPRAPLGAPRARREQAWGGKSPIR